MRTTIIDVAKMAGVSPSTVTRVIQNSPSISVATKAAVRKVIEELNYHPNLNARSLVNKCTRVIGLVLPNDSDVFFQNPFFPQALIGISQVATENGYVLQIGTGKNDKERLAIVEQMVDGLRVDGLIFLYSQPGDPLAAFVEKRKFPFVILGKSTSDFISLVDNDNVKAAFEATAYFLNKGYRKVAFIGGNKELAVSQDRHKGYLKALEAYHIPVDEHIIKFSMGFLLENRSYKVMKELSVEDLEAVVTTDIIVAEGVLHFIKASKINLPIISFDSVKPKIDIEAYVDINALELARQACSTLFQILKDRQENKSVSYRIVIPHKIIKL